MKNIGTKELQTKRLILRRFRFTDAKAMYENWASDAEVTKYLMWPTHTDITVSETILSEWVNSYKKNDYYQWAIIIKGEEDKPIGDIAAVQVDSTTSKVHIGYCIGRKWWKKGYMSEALQEVMRFFFNECDCNRVEARFDTKNPNSGAVMRKCGMQFEGILREADWNNQGICDANCYAMLKSEWLLKEFRITQAELSKKIEDALFSYVSVVADGKRPYYKDNQLGWVKTAPTAWSNYIFYYNYEKNLQDSVDIDQHLQNIKSQVINGKLPNEWVVGPQSTPTDLCSRLEKLGYEKYYEMAGMAIDIEHADLTLSIPEKLAVRAVQNRAELDIWADIVSRGLWDGRPFEATLFYSLLEDERFRFYLGFLGEQPVAASMLQMEDGIADLDLICTLYEHQRKGIGDVMTKMPLLYARSKGYKIGVLQASMAGDHGYRKIGFKEYCRFYVYRYLIVLKYEEITKKNRTQVNKFLVEHWFSTEMVLRGQIVDMTIVDGIVVYQENGSNNNQDIKALLTYAITKDTCEILSLDSLISGQGIASELMNRMIAIAREKKLKKVILITTNDNLNAMQFYQKRGFTMTALYQNAMDDSRKIKPSIPMLGENDIPLQHEIEFTYWL